MSEIESDRVPQHDPPPDADLVQPEVDARDDSLVVEGDDRDHVLPPTELDPFTPDPAPPTQKARAALWAAIAVSLFYLVVASATVPHLWIDPLGPMLKIAPIMVLNLVALAILEDR